MEPITGRNLQIIENCVNFAREFLYLPPTIKYYFEDCPSFRFPQIINCAESDGNNVYINKAWYEKSMPDHQDDVEFYIFHELRHIHQLISIERMLNCVQCQDEYSQIHTWKNNFENYVRNVGDEESQAQNLSQEIEIDANGYALSLLNLYYIIHQGITNPQFKYSLPRDAHKIANIRSQEYYKSKSELHNYIATYKLKKRPEQLKKQEATSTQKNEPIRKGRKIGPNEKCPCGSGKKFKQCCRNKGIYD